MRRAGPKLLACDRRPSLGAGRERPQLQLDPVADVNCAVEVDEKRIELTPQRRVRNRQPP